MAETREDAHKAFDRTLKRFEAKYPQAMDCLRKDRDALLAFYVSTVTQFSPLLVIENSPTPGC